MQEWEFTQVTYYNYLCNEKNVEEAKKHKAEVVELGRTGWEPINVVQDGYWVTWYFKRQFP